MLAEGLGVRWPERERHELFAHFASPGGETARYGSLLSTLRGPLDARRADLVLAAFQALDVTCVVGLG